MTHNSARPSSPAAFRRLSGKFANIDFTALGFPNEMHKEEFLRALWNLSDFRSRGFSFDRLAAKIVALFQHDSSRQEIMKVVHFWIYHAVMDLARDNIRAVNGDVLGTAGEISGIYEVIFKRENTLAGIKLGKFSDIQLPVLDRKGIEVKIFDAASVDAQESIITVFEFKFTLTLRKLYEQVIGMDSAKLPHLVVLTRFKEFEQVRNLVYFREVGDSRLTQAMQIIIEQKPWIAERVTLTRRGFSMKLFLTEIRDFLCNQRVLSLARKTGKPFVSGHVHSEEYRNRLRQMVSIINNKIKQQESKENPKFDVIIAVSNAPKERLRGIRKLVRNIQTTAPYD